MRTATVRVKPDDYILAVLSPKDRLDAAFRVAGEAFKKTTLTMEDINNAVKTVRRKAYEKKD
ncbi:MAG: hypothetical protein Q7T53_00430 [Deltaproteobacteria bacterium]|nr:hypothetical protein [Deltaproteobacteria bacterium]